MIDIKDSYTSDLLEWISSNTNINPITGSGYRVGMTRSDSTLFSRYGNHVIFKDIKCNKKENIKEDTKDVDFHEFEKILNGG